MGLAREHRALIDAAFAINEGGGAALKDGKHFRNSVQASEKVSVNFRLTVKNPGGHSSVPSKENAITRLSAGLVRLGAFDFPVHLNDVTRSYFEKLATIESPEIAADMKAILAPTPDPAAVARLADKPFYNAQMRTTCVATRLDGGHAVNALPQTARATINCRMLPNDKVEDILAGLVSAVADDKIAVEMTSTPQLSPPSPLDSELMNAAQRLSAEMWPGIPVIPVMSTGATDSLVLRNIGIPAYGTSGLFTDPADNRTHGLNERIPVQSLYDGQEYLYRLVKMLATP